MGGWIGSDSEAGVPGTAIGGFPMIATVLCPWREGVVRKMVEKRQERRECLAHRTVEGGRSAGADRGRGSGLMIPSPIPTVATPARASSCSPVFIIIMIVTTTTFLNDPA